MVTKSFKIGLSDWVLDLQTHKDKIKKIKTKNTSSGINKLTNRIETYTFSQVQMFSTKTLYGRYTVNSNNSCYIIETKVIFVVF